MTMCDESYRTTEQEINALRKGDLINEIERLQDQLTKAESRNATLQELNKTLANQGPKFDQALNDQIRFSNAVDKQMQYERDRRHRAEALLDRMFTPERKLKHPGRKRKGQRDRYYL